MGTTPIQPVDVAQLEGLRKYLAKKVGDRNAKLVAAAIAELQQLRQQVIQLTAAAAPAEQP